MTRGRKVEAAVIGALAAVLCAEIVVVHALIEHALKAGNDALDTLHELTEEPS